MPATSTGPTDAYAAFRLPAYRAFWLYRLFGSSAIQIQSVAVGWQIYELTKDPQKLGLIGLAEAVPALGVSLLAGHVADVMSRGAILRISNGLMLFATAALAALSLPSLHQFLVDHLWLIYGVIFLTGLCRGFLSPAHFGLLGQIVPTELYGNASIWNANVWQAACIGGPAAAGFLYGYCGAAWTYGLSALMLFLGWASLFAIKTPPATRVARAEQSIVASIHEGLRFVFSNQVILGAMSLDLFAVLFGGAVALLPIYADQILHTGPFGLGLLRASPAIGSALVGVYLSYRPIRRLWRGDDPVWHLDEFLSVHVLPVSQRVL
jgi:hypothetical protein